MDITVLIGSIIFGFLLLESIGFDSFVSLFINFDALILVAGCTLAATLVHFPVKQVFQIWLRLKFYLALKNTITKWTLITCVEYPKTLNHLVALKSFWKKSIIAMIIS